MTLQDLIDELTALPESARTATVTVRVGDIEDSEILSASYQGGEASINCLSDGKNYDEGVEDGRKAALKDVQEAIESLT